MRTRKMSSSPYSHIFVTSLIMSFLHIVFEGMSLIHRANTCVACIHTGLVLRDLIHSAAFMINLDVLKAKVKFALEQTTNALKGRRDISLRFL
jgi:hypothetical protein